MVSMAKTFTRIGKDIVMAVKDGGSSIETNSKLRAVFKMQRLLTCLKTILKGL